MNHPPRFALVQLDRTAHDPMALARALAAVRGTPVQDQVLQAKGSWGIVAEGLPEDEAKALRDALWSNGVRCAVGPEAAMVSLPPVEPASTIDALPAAEPTLIAVAGMDVVTMKTRTVKKGPGGAQKIARAAILMTTGIPIKVGTGKRPVQKKEEEHGLAFCADVCYEDPAVRLRIDASRFDFSCLGTRRLYQAQGNLKLLVSDLVQAAPQAWTNHGTRVLVEGRPIRTMGYRSWEDLEREERWLLTLRKFGL